ncbi:MAG: response regulator [Reichenbachiella sp.]
MTRVMIILLSLIFVSNLLFAQTTEIKFSHLQQSDGLSSSDITCFVQDDRGFIWIGTVDGLNRYDGYNIDIYRNELDNPQSLADNSITCLYTDRFGELWIGTENYGLSKYERETDTFINYDFDIFDANSINFNYITSICEDSVGDLWVATLMGLNKYAREENQFERYLYQRILNVTDKTMKYSLQQGYSNSLQSALINIMDTVYLDEFWFTDYLSQHAEEGDTYDVDSLISNCKLGNFGQPIRVLQPDQHGGIWVGTEYDGLLYVFDGQVHQKITTDNSAISSNEITSLYFENQTLWIGTKSGGLNRMNLIDNIISSYDIPWASKNIKCILKGHKSNLWIGNDRGLGVFDPVQNTFIQQSIAQDNDKGLLSETISSLYEDLQGNLWVGSFQGGVNLRINGHPFEHLKHTSNENSALTKNRISSILEDSKGRLWVGYYTSGIDMISNGVKTHFGSGNPNNSIGEGSVFSLFEDKEGRIWTGAYQGGLHMFDENTSSFSSIDDLFIDGDIRGMSEDSFGNLWLALHGKGICRYDKKNGVKHYKTVYPNLSNTLSSNWVNDVMVDSKNRVWAASVTGISILHQDAPDFISYFKENSNLSHNNVRITFEDSKGRIWLGTDNGLNLFLDSLRGFQVFTTQDGLPNNSIRSIEEDNAGALWISTNNGLCKFDFDKNVVKNYYEEDGLQANDFFPKASFKSFDGKLHFGGKNGLTSFFPITIKDNEFKPPVYLTQFKLFGKEVKSGDQTGILSTQIASTNDLVLNYDQNFFSISFTGINYVNPTRNQYKVQLEGLHDEWIDMGTMHETTFTSLPSGKYKFNVKASNNDGLWNDQSTLLNIEILPPFWMTTMAYALYITLLLIIIAIIYRAALDRIRLQHQREIDDMKIRFFANVSHELRTPLTLIMGPLSELKRLNSSSNKPTQQGEMIHMIERNANRLLRLVNQLLDFYQLDAGFAKLSTSDTPLPKFILHIYESFEFKAEKKNITYQINDTLVPKTTGYIDRDKLEKVLYNLISNSIKFTANNGKVIISTALTSPSKDHLLSNKIQLPENNEKQYLRISVQDNGVGIPEHLKTKIFERFYQSDHTDTDEPGTGIGLSMVSQLTKIQKGHVHLESDVGVGSSFVIWVPIDKDHLQNHEILNSEVNFDQKSIAHISNNKNQIDTLLDLIIEDKPSLLIIEDSDDIRSFIRSSLQEQYCVKEAKNGHEGIKYAEEHTPDLILLDIMMPGKNGNEVCEILKKNPKTSHIPIIILTAKTGDDSQLKGLSHGADDYMTKPFNIDILQSRISNRIVRQKMLKLKYEEAPIIPKGILTSQKDEQFIKDLYQLIDDNIANPELTPDSLANDLGMSRSVLYRNVKKCASTSVSLVIRNYRIDRAAQILKSNVVSIKELCFMVGFKDPAYFTSCFKKRIYVSPTEYNNPETVVID